MSLDLPTLFVVATCITALLGLFLIMLWMQDRSVRALGWWAMAYLFGGIAVMIWLLQPSATGMWSQDLASALLFLCCGLLWCGARAFHGRGISGLATAAGAVCWLVVTRIPDVALSGNARMIASSLIITVYVTLTAMELKRDRRRESASRRHAIVLAGLHGVVFLSPIVAQYAYPHAAGNFGEGFFALFALLTLLYVVGTAFIVVVMAKEQALALHKTAASTDPLTGLFNRRGFFENAQRLLDARLRKGVPISVLMFDLDHFKSINDRFGHDIGDETLRLFAATISSAMRSEDIIGRLGGEEFVAILPNGIASAIGIAQRVRLAFEAAAIEVAGHSLNATVSIGASEAITSADNIAQLLARADAALYRAKSSGRNRVVADAGPDAIQEAPPLAPEVTLRCNESAKTLSAFEPSGA
jgi:diguanylate cyclase (GGDEF)-like protein